MYKELLKRVQFELIDVLNSINNDKIHHDGDDFHELLLDVEAALEEPASEDSSVAQQRTWVGLTEEELRIAFGKLYPNDIGLLELTENNKDYAVEAIGARHHWTAFKAGARAGEAKLKEKNI